MSETYRAEFLPHEPILIHQVCSGYHYTTDAPAFIEESTRLLDSASEPVYFIADYRELRISFDELIEAASIFARGAGSLYHHPNIIQIVAITTDPVIKLAAKGLGTDIFGGLQIEVFETLEAGVDYARQKIGALAV